MNNNKLSGLPTQLRLLYNLRVLCLSNNLIAKLQELPWTSIQCLFIDKNLFTELPLNFADLQNRNQVIRLEWFRQRIRLKINQEYRYARPELPLHFEVSLHQQVFTKLCDRMRSIEKSNKQISIKFEDFVQAASIYPYDLQVRDSKGRNFIFNATQDEHLGVIKHLAAHYPYMLESLDDERKSPLGLSIQAQLDRSANVLLQCGANPNKTNSQYQIYLHLALQLRNIGLVQLLLQSGADSNCKNIDGNSALHILFTGWSKGDQFTSIKLAELLLLYGSDPNLKNNESLTALHLAVKHVQFGAIKFALTFNTNNCSERQLKQSTKSHKKSSSFSTGKSTIFIQQERRSKGSYCPPIDYRNRHYRYYFLHLSAKRTQSNISIFHLSNKEQHPNYMDFLKVSSTGLSILQVCYPALVLKKWTRKLVRQRLLSLFQQFNLAKEIKQIKKSGFKNQSNSKHEEVNYPPEETKKIEKQKLKTVFKNICQQKIPGDDQLDENLFNNQDILLLEDDDFQILDDDSLHKAAQQIKSYVIVKQIPQQVQHSNVLKSSSHKFQTKLLQSKQESQNDPFGLEVEFERIVCDIASSSILCEVVSKINQLQFLQVKVKTTKLQFSSKLIPQYYQFLNEFLNNPKRSTSILTQAQQTDMLTKIQQKVINTVKRCAIKNQQQIKTCLEVIHPLLKGYSSLPYDEKMKLILAASDAGNMFTQVKWLITFNEVTSQSIYILLKDMYQNTILLLGLLRLLKTYNPNETQIQSCNSRNTYINYEMFQDKLYGQQKFKQNIQDPITLMKQHKLKTNSNNDKMSKVRSHSQMKPHTNDDEAVAQEDSINISNSTTLNQPFVKKSRK